MEIVINLIQEERQKNIAAFQNTNSLSPLFRVLAGWLSWAASAELLSPGFLVGSVGRPAGDGRAGGDRDGDTSRLLPCWAFSWWEENWWLFSNGGWIPSSRPQLPLWTLLLSYCSPLFSFRPRVVKASSCWLCPRCFIFLAIYISISIPWWNSLQSPLLSTQFISYRDLDKCTNTHKTVISQWELSWWS